MTQPVVPMPISEPQGEPVKAAAKKTKLGFLNRLFGHKKDSKVSANISSKDIPPTSDATKKKEESSKSWISRMIASIRGAFKQKAEKTQPKESVKTTLDIKAVTVKDQKEMVLYLISELKKEEHLNQEGILRISGAKTAVNAYLMELNQNRSALPKTDATNNLVGALKEIFQNFDGGKRLINQEARQAFVAFGDPMSKSSEEDKIAAMKRAIDKLPPDNKEILKEFCQLAEAITSKSEINKMKLSNVLIAIGISLHAEGNNPMQDLMDLGPVNSALNFMITNHEQIF